MIPKKLKMTPAGCLAFLWISLLLVVGQSVAVKAGDRPPTHLKGEAKKFQAKTQLIKGKALLDAQKQFKLDVAMFSSHANAYNLHINEARQALGPYLAGKEDCNKMKKNLAINVSQLRIGVSDVRPPHSCLRI